MEGMSGNEKQDGGLSEILCSVKDLWSGQEINHDAIADRYERARDGGVDIFTMQLRAGGGAGADILGGEGEGTVDHWVGLAADAGDLLQLFGAGELHRRVNRVHNRRVGVDGLLSEFNRLPHHTPGPGGIASIGPQTVLQYLTLCVTTIMRP